MKTPQQIEDKLFEVKLRLDKYKKELEATTDTLQAVEIETSVQSLNIIQKALKWVLNK